MKDFEEAIDRLIAGLEKKRVMSDKEREIVAYHESGHAIVATVLPGLDPVHKISIVQRGFGALGYTMQLPLEDRYLMTRSDLLSQLAVLLGGRTRRGDRARRDLDRRAERSAARHRHRARDGHRVRDERRARRHQLRRPPARDVPRHPASRRSAGSTPRTRRGRSTPRSSASSPTRTTRRARSCATTGTCSIACPRGCSRRKSSRPTS